MEPIHKFNNGRGAMLCNICRTIISTGPKTKELFCEKCKPKQDEIMERFIANAKHEGKELTKEEVMKERSSAYEFIDFDKQETTLEEVAEYHIKMQYPMGVEKEYPINDFIEGAKWQAERMYSEEDMRKAINFMPYHLEYGNIVARKSDKDIENFIEKFKKK